MVVGFTTTYAIDADHHLRCGFISSSGEVYSIQHYVIKFVNDLGLVAGFLRVRRFPPLINKPPRYSCNIFKSGVKRHNHNLVVVHCHIPLITITNCYIIFKINHEIRYFDTPDIVVFFNLENMHFFK